MLLCRMNHHDGIEPYKFSLALRNDVIEIVLLYRRKDGCVYCVTELVELVPLRQLRYFNFFLLDSLLAIDLRVQVY